MPEKMNMPTEATNFENNGGQGQSVPGGTGPGTPTKAHPGTGAKGEPTWPGYGKPSPGRATWKQEHGKEPASWKQKHW